MSNYSISASLPVTYLLTLLASVTYLHCVMSLTVPSDAPPARLVAADAVLPTADAAAACTERNAKHVVTALRYCTTYRYEVKMS